MPLTLGMLTSLRKPKAPALIGAPTRGNASSMSHTVVEGTDCLVMRIALSNENAVSSPLTCSWNGIAMERGAYCYGSNNNNGALAVIFYLMNPPPGTGNFAYAANDNRIGSAENWKNVSGIGANRASTASSQLSSFSFAFTKTDPLNVLIAAAILRQGTAWTPGSNNIEEYDAGWSSPANHRAYFGRAETTSTLAASCSGGTNTFGACGLELVAG